MLSFTQAARIAWAIFAALIGSFARSTTQPLECLYQFCVDTLKGQHYDYFVFGHRHLPIDKPLAGGARYINLGDWISFYTYGQWDGTQFALKTCPHDGL